MLIQRRVCRGQHQVSLGKGLRVGQRAGQATGKEAWKGFDLICKKIPITCRRLVKRLLEYFRIKIRTFCSKKVERKMVRRSLKLI